MKTPLLAALLASVLGCGSSSSPSSTMPAPAPAPTDTAAVPAPPPSNKPKPEYGTWGFDATGMDTSVAPGQSFFQYADGAWVKRTPMPEDKSNYGLFTLLNDKSDERTKGILEAASGAPDSDAQRIGDYYKTFMDEAAIEQLGARPLQPMLAEIAKIKDTSGLMVAFAKGSRRLDRSMPFATGVGQDDKQPDQYIAGIGQGGLGLPDRDMYDAKNAQFESMRAGYRKYLAQVFALIGQKDGQKDGPKNFEARAAAVYALEEKIAQTHWTRIQNRDPEKTYNKLTIADLTKLAPDVDWKAWLKTVGYDGQPAVLVAQPPAIAATAKLVKSQPLAVWKDFLTAHLVTHAAPYLSKAFVDAHFEMFGKVASGTPQIQARWKRAVTQVDRGMGEAAGQLYVAKYFPPETKAAADKLVKNLLAAMGRQLDGLTWMGAETKAKAKAKLATYNPKIGYPTKWRDYTGLKIVAGDAVGNALRVADFEYNRQLKHLGQPIDRDEWGMTPMTVNAYYNPQLNEIVFPAAILQPPFFDPNADDAVNYGGIGAVIGHEISHGFDDQGSQYDATGALKNWWTDDDKTKFKAATAKLVAQYDGYCPVAAADGKPAQCVKGQLTLGENIADLAGLTIAYSAYKLSLDGKPGPVIEGTTAEQRFYLGWGQIWRRIYRPQELSNRLVTDPHSPAEFRVATVRNLDLWYDAFKPKETDAMYLSPDKRVRIW